jgi:hypothetical protein
MANATYRDLTILTKSDVCIAQPNTREIGLRNDFPAGHDETGFNDVIPRPESGYRRPGISSKVWLWGYFRDRREQAFNRVRQGRPKTSGR